MKVLNYGYPITQISACQIEEKDYTNQKFHCSKEPNYAMSLEKLNSTNQLAKKKKKMLSGIR